VRLSVAVQFPVLLPVLVALERGEGLGEQRFCGIRRWEAYADPAGTGGEEGDWPHGSVSHSDGDRPQVGQTIAFRPSVASLANSIRGGSLRMIDDEYFDRTLARRELQSELFL